ncbi:hypothetical protein BDZ97DRAFT_1668299 [Flammula alnicola]|nr:hypothetical protein BDZ97DRAFT_1668299 [Flammula alnicola]
MPRVNITDEAFKKTEQVVGRPEVTKKNINEEYMRNAPNNTDHTVNQHKQSYPIVRDEEEAYEEEVARSLESGIQATGQREDMGRSSKTEELATIAHDDAVHR